MSEPQNPTDRARSALPVVLGLLAAAALVGWLLLAEPSAPTDGNAALLRANANGAQHDIEGVAAVDAVAPEERRATGSGAVGDEGPSPGAMATFGEVVIHVRARDGGAPVPGAYVWTVPSHSEALVTGADGTVRFQAESGALIAGVESASGYLLWTPAAEADGQPGEVGSSLEQEVMISPRETTTIELFVRLGAVIRGTLADANGNPVPRGNFYLAEAEGNGWSIGKRRRTDDLGAFEIIGLRPNWYLVGYDPKERDVFPYEKVRADWGSVHELHLQYQRSSHVEIEVVPEGVGPDEPWDFSLAYMIHRNDRMTVETPPRAATEAEWLRRQPLRGSLGPESESASEGEKTRDRWPHGPVSIEAKLAEGPYLLEVRATGRSRVSPDTVWWMGQAFTRSYPFQVDAEGRVRFTGDAPPGTPTHRAVVQGMEQVTYLEASLVGAPAQVRVREKGQGMGWFLHSDSLRPDDNGQAAMNVAIDAVRFAPGSLVFHEVHSGEPERLMHEVELVPGVQKITLRCLGQQDESK